MAKKLNLNLYKNDSLVYEEKNVPYYENNDEISFLLDEVNNTINLLENNLIYERENDEYKFSLNINKENNTCKYLLKELDSYINIEVEDAIYKVFDNNLEIMYQLESDDDYTKIVIVLEK